MDFTHLQRAYTSIYFKDDNSSEYLNENFEYIDEEYDMIVEDILLEEDIIEEVVFEMIEEGFEPEEIEEIFEEILDEARVDMASRAAARKQYMASSEKSAKEARGRAAEKERSEKRAAQVAAVKGKVKGAISKAKEKIGAAKSAVRAKIKDTKQQSHKGLAKYASKRNLMPGPGLKTQSSKGRGELRKAVAKDVAKRVKGKATEYAGKAKSAVKSGIGKVARKVATGAGKVASRLGEELDTYDLVLEYLCVEGYAEDLEEAEWMMANIIDEEAINIILGEEQLDEADSLAAMQARREKRLAAQRKREGTTSTGRDFGRNDSLSSAQQKARRDAEYKAGTNKEEFEVWFNEAMSNYEKNRKRAAQRAAARNEARKQGKTGAVPGVGYVTPRPERETWTDESGKTRHAKGL